MNDMIMVVFSKNRPLQLHLCLDSFYLQCKDNPQIAVIYVADKDYENSYTNMQKDFPLVDFIKQTDFKENLLDGVSGREFVFFVCDDTIFTNKFSLSDVVYCLETYDRLLGFSLRLGTNITYCYMADVPQKIGNYVEMDDMIFFNWVESELDFAYPLEVSSSVYRTQDLTEALYQCNYSNPNELESSLAINLNLFKGKPFLASYKQSVSFCNALNKVQAYNNNRSGTNFEYLPSELFLKYQEGFRVNPQQFSGFVNNSPHMEVEFDFS